jgi:hypothetical protein
VIIQNASVLPRNAMPRTEGRAGVRPPSQWLKCAHLSSAVDYLCVMWALVEVQPDGSY